MGSHNKESLMRALRFAQGKAQAYYEATGRIAEAVIQRASDGTACIAYKVKSKDGQREHTLLNLQY